MANIFKTPNIKMGIYGKLTVASKHPSDFYYLIGMNVNDIILFDDGTD